MIPGILLSCLFVTALPPASLRGPVPFAVKIAPTVGEDLAPGTIVAMIGAPDSVFIEPFGPKPDADLPQRGRWSKAKLSERAMAAFAAQLDQAAIDDGAPCDSLPQEPEWPPTWHVRFLGPDLRVAREFNVPVRVVRCRARARYDALEDDPEMRATMRTLMDLGASPPRLAPDVERLAILRGPMDAVVLSLVGPDPAVATLRLASSPAVAATSDAIHLDESSMRSALHAALVHPLFASGMMRTPSDLSRRQRHAEIRVLERVPGSSAPVLRLIAYMSPAEAAEIAKQVVAAVTPTEAAAIRARIAGTDR
jgi:hypothetical protein